MLPYWRLSAYYFFYFAFLGLYSPYFSLYLQSLSFSAWEIALLMSLSQIMRIVAPNVWGWLADRSGVRMPIIRVASLLAMLGFSGLFFTQSFSGVFAAMAVQAFFWAAALPLMEAVTLGHLDRQAARYGRIRLWGSLGFVLGVLGIGHVLNSQPVDVLLPMSLAMLLTVLLCSAFVPESPWRAHEAEQQSITAVLRQTRVLKLLAACGLMSAAHAAMYIFLSIFLVGHGYSKAQIGWLWSLGVIVEIGVFMLMPRVLGRFSPWRILAVAMACAALRFVLTGWAGQWWWLIALVQAMHGITFGAHHAAAMSAIGQLFQGRHHARGQALYASLSFGGGGMIGGLFSGWAWDQLGGPITFTISALFALLGFLLIRTVEEK